MNEAVTAVLTETRDWAVKELEFAKTRAENLRVGGEAYNHAIAVIKDLTHMVDELAYLIGEKRYEWETETAEPLHEVRPEPVSEDSSGEDRPGKSTTNPDPDPAPKKPARTIDLAEVRTKAKAARDAGVKLADVWAAFDATKLSEVPHEKYGEVLDMLEKKLKELD